MARLDGIIEPIYFLITSITFILLSIIQYKKFGKTRETKYLAGLSIFFLCSYIAIILKIRNDQIYSASYNCSLHCSILGKNY